jgi:hypothetical protein
MGISNTYTSQVLHTPKDVDYQKKFASNLF